MDLWILKAYAAGYNIVILSGDFQRVQVLLSGNENNQSLLTCIDCTYEFGKVRWKFFFFCFSLKIFIENN